MPALKSKNKEAKEVPIFNKKLTQELVIKGTSIDRINALCDLIRNHPKRKLEYLDQLLNICAKKGRRECIPAIEKTKNAFINDIFDRKVNRFHIDDESNQQFTKRYSLFLNHIKELLNDHLPKVRAKMCGILFDLMKSIQINRKILLLELINRFGDTENFVSAHVSLLLLKHLKNRIDFTAPLVNEICLFLGRPNLAFKAKYYCICFLNQIFLTPELHDVANMLCKVYFGIFDSLKSEEDSKHKMLQALLTGLNRAIPYTTDLSATISEKIDQIFKIVHTSSFQLSIQALVMIFHIKNEKQEINDRFYNALYSVLTTYSINSTNRGIMLFLNLLYKSMAQDTCDPRRKAFVKKLIQVSLHSSPEFACSSLLMLSEVFKTKESFLKLLQSYNNKFDEDLSEIVGKSTASWVFKNIREDDVKTDKYLPHHINPKYCGAQMTSVWECAAMIRHYHLSVQPFTQNLINSSLTYEGDPLVDFTHSRFIDRFTQRSVKEKKQTPNIMSRDSYITAPIANVPSNQDILNKNETELTEEEKLFYKYYKTKVIESTKKIKNSKSKNKDQCDFSSDEEIFDSSRPKDGNIKSKKSEFEAEDSDFSDNSVFLDSEEDEGDHIIVSKKLKGMNPKKAKHAP